MLRLRSSVFRYEVGGALYIVGRSREVMKYAG